VSVGMYSLLGVVC